MQIGVGLDARLGLSFEQQLDIALYLNFDMIGSPNAGYFAFDGDNSDGVGSGLRDGRECAGCLTQLVIEHQCVEGDVALYPAAVQRPHHLRQFVQCEPNFRARREMFEPEVHRVRARFDSGAELGPISRGTHDFRFTADVHGGLSLRLPLSAIGPLE